MKRLRMGEYDNKLPYPAPVPFTLKGDKQAEADQAGCFRRIRIDKSPKS
jgi:hypothetical protein